MMKIRLPCFNDDNFDWIQPLECSEPFETSVTRNVFTSLQNGIGSVLRNKYYVIVFHNIL